MVAGEIDEVGTAANDDAVGAGYDEPALGRPPAAEKELGGHATTLLLGAGRTQCHTGVWSRSSQQGQNAAVAFDMDRARRRLTTSFPLVNDHPDVAGVLRDAELLDVARKEAVAWLEKDPGLSGPESAELKRAIEKRWGDKLRLAEVG